MERLRKLIKEVLPTPPTKKDCNCGCNSCSNVGNPGVVLNENKIKKISLSKNLQYHIDNKLPLTENTFRYGSKAFLNLWAEARALYSREVIHVNELDKEILEETNLGEYGIIYEIEIGDRVKASKEYGGLSGEVVDIRGSFIVVKTKEGNQSYHESDLKVLNREGKKVPLDFPILEENEEISFKKGDIVYDKHTKAKLKVTRIFKDRIYVVPFNSPGRDEEWYRKEELTKQSFFQENKITTDQLGYLTESKNENKPIGKPMRGGSKKFYVYVRDPKTKKIKKVSFGGTTGLSVKINDPKARKAFAARHDCKNKKDRTKPSYWSCNVGKYWKQLGGEKNFSGYW